MIIRKRFVQFFPCFKVKQPLQKESVPLQYFTICAGSHGWFWIDGWFWFIYKRHKKVRKKKENTLSTREPIKKKDFFSWSLSWSRACFLSFFLDRSRFFYFSWSLSWSRACFLSFLSFFLYRFLGRKRVFFSYFFVFFYKFPPLLCSFHILWIFKIVYFLSFSECQSTNLPGLVRKETS